MGLTGSSEKDAFDNLAQAVKETGVGLGALARALLDLVSNVEGSAHHAEAMHTWGHLLANRVTSAKASA